MFIKSARFYDALYHFKDYEKASNQLHSLIQVHNPNANTLLDVGCGTGKHVSHLQAHYEVEGLDLNRELLEIARERCPTIVFHESDMTDFSLDRKFDVVTCLFSAIAYVKTVEGLEAAMTNMSRHLNPEGLLVIEPWLFPENYWTSRLTANFVDQPELKIAWMYTSELDGSVSVFDIHYLAGTTTTVEHFSERHEMGLFTHQQYLESFSKAGLIVSYDPIGFFGRGMYSGVKSQKRSTPNS